MAKEKVTILHRWFDEVWNSFDFLNMFQQMRVVRMGTA